MPEPDEIIETINSVAGDITAAAEMLGISDDQLRKLIRANPQLMALYAADPGKVVSGADLLNRPSPAKDATPEDQSIISLVQDQNYENILDGFLAVGVPKKTIDNIRTLRKFESNAGRFMLATMDILQGLVGKSALRLDSYLEYIHEQITDDNIPAKEKAMWIRAFGVSMDHLLKANRDVRDGSLAIARATRRSPDAGAPAKPGFTPLKPADPA